MFGSFGNNQQPTSLFGGANNQPQTTLSNGFGQQNSNTFGSQPSTLSTTSNTNPLLQGNQGGPINIPVLPNEISLDNGHTDSITDIQFSPVNQTQFMTSSWDGFVRVWDFATGAITKFLEYNHSGNAPVLSSLYSTDGTKVISGGADGIIHIYDIQTRSLQTLATLNSPVAFLKRAVINGMELIISGSFNNVINYWDIRTFNATQPLSSLQLPDKLFCMDANDSGILVCGCANKNVHLINMTQPNVIFKTTQINLKQQPRGLKCIPGNQGFIIASIEGRCSVVYFDEAVHKKDGFTFRCHRQSQRTFNPLNLTNNTLGNIPTNYKGSFVYAVNSVEIHPTYGTLATAASDGVISFWNVRERHRIKGLPTASYPIVASSFNANGTLLAYALSYDWSYGSAGSKPNNPVVIRIHQCTDEEIKEKKR